MVPYFSMQKNLVAPLQKYAKIIDSPVYSIDEITGGPVWAKVWNIRWSRYKFRGPVSPNIDPSIRKLNHFTILSLTDPTTWVRSLLAGNELVTQVATSPLEYQVLSAA